jgi:hypothetical protein
MAASNVAMVAVMTMTPIHMQGAGEPLAAVGLVISLHVAGMYLIAGLGLARRPLRPAPGDRGRRAGAARGGRARGPRPATTRR